MENLPSLADHGETEDAEDVTAAEGLSSRRGLETNGHKSQSCAKAPVGEDLIDLVQEIENLTKDDAIARLLHLEDRDGRRSIGPSEAQVVRPGWFFGRVGRE
jgi:hypothetical protein